ncbi:murein DD-endopeptidase MepM/ murein hydrolase activator NlpD [Cupriavidus metallidurans]|jgi:murein DD-endopeptidase MepM/ murein hydrolase activator NlpD|uniref:M23 family metallopeptidase n=1 Tax=Cupriavidus TaxID=106589 RepID=UPI000493213A|nr:M23 family metallopeptidase [Cupriavidus metallidurans]AVA33206.1 LysM peptidoglycan-binding domain-containing protein [Cupriavidus metallidurans]MDE4917410.1 peptidoglycan DD-metalloendopeptidase family protein [Cupriavidus metallidurans]
MNRTHHANLQTRRRALGALGSLAAISLSALLAACGTTPTEPAPDGFYRVERGDTLYSIARRNKRSVSELARWNNMSNTNQIEVGQLIRVRPPGGASTSAAATPQSDKPARPVQDMPSAKPPASSISLQWPADGRVSGRFAPPAEKGMRIEVPAGGKVRAAAPGWAIHVGTLRGYGMLVIVKHNDDWLTVYGNLDKPLVKEGDRVTAGQEIGSMAQAAELHFEVRGNGRPLNPANYLPSRG